jgi:ADP-glucose pyrophosphorylase
LTNYSRLFILCQYQKADLQDHIKNTCKKSSKGTAKKKAFPPRRDKAHNPEA